MTFLLFSAIVSALLIPLFVASPLITPLLEKWEPGEAGGLEPQLGIFVMTSRGTSHTKLCQNRRQPHLRVLPV